MRKLYHRHRPVPALQFKHTFLLIWLMKLTRGLLLLLHPQHYLNWIPQQHYVFHITSKILCGKKSTLSNLKRNLSGVAGSTASRARVYHCRPNYYYSHVSIHELLVDLWRMLDNVNHISSIRGTSKEGKCNLITLFFSSTPST